MSNVPELSNSHDFLSLDQIMSHAMQEQLLVLDSSLSVSSCKQDILQGVPGQPRATVGKSSPISEAGNGISRLF
jgi:hypothetical protein